jgi:hypothetical protein
LAVAGEVSRDLAELAAEGHDRFAEVGPALLDVGGDPRGDGGTGLRVGGVGHVVHDGRGWRGVGRRRVGQVRYGVVSLPSGG